MQTCFGPCTEPSSGLTCVGGDYRRLCQDRPLPLAPRMPPILSHTEDSQHWLRHISATTSDDTEDGTSRLYRALGHFPTTVASAYYSTSTRHGGVPMPTWQPSIQRFSMKYYLHSEVQNSLHTTHHATDLHQAHLITS